MLAEGLGMRTPAQQRCSTLRTASASRILFRVAIAHALFGTLALASSGFGEQEGSVTTLAEVDSVPAGATCANGPPAPPEAVGWFEINVERAQKMAVTNNIRACNQDESEPDWAQLQSLRRSKYAFVILAQKAHSSYGTNQLARLQASVDSLYKNYNNQFRNDVLIFYTKGKSADDTFNKEDEKLLQQPDRKEVHLIEITGHYWSLPVFINQTKLSSYTMPKFSYGYRLMCRWYSHKVFEWTAKMGYTHIARMDDDSLILSKINYNLFEFMEEYGVEYAFRVDAFEGCCDVPMRRRILDGYLKANPHVKPTFLHSCCTNGSAMSHNMYGRCLL